MNSTAISEGRKLLSVKERMRFERYMAEIFSRLGMDLNSESCRRTPQRWVQALVDMTEGYNGDPNIEVVFERECVNCAHDIPTVQIVYATRRSLGSRNSSGSCANMRAGSRCRNA
jgi:GTP cyclohydrolase I